MPEKVFIRGIPDELWRAVKARAALEGITISKAVSRAIRLYLAGFDTMKTSSSKDPWADISDLGKSGRSDISKNHDRYIAEASHLSEKE